MKVNFPKSTCALCGKKYAKTGILRHLKSCLPKYLERGDGKKGKEENFIYLRVRDAYENVYFLHLLVKENLQLSYLDSFLREIWLECCGHLSDFYYERFGEEIDMSRKIKNVLRPKQGMHYIYDFGSSTELLIENIGNFKGKTAVKDPVFIMSRNAAPEIPCTNCGGGPAVSVCTECVWEGNGWLCKSCAKEHEEECGEEMILPVVNSPRVGTCCYEG